MRIVEVRAHSIPVSRYADPHFVAGDPTTSLVAVNSDVVRSGRPVIGYGYASSAATECPATWPSWTDL